MLAVVRKDVPHAAVEHRVQGGEGSMASEVHDVVEGDGALQAFHHEAVAVEQRLQDGGHVALCLNRKNVKCTSVLIARWRSGSSGHLAICAPCCRFDPRTGRNLCALQ